MLNNEKCFSVLLAFHWYTGATWKPKALTCCDQGPCSLPKWKRFGGKWMTVIELQLETETKTILTFTQSWCHKMMPHVKKEPLSVRFVYLSTAKWIHVLCFKWYYWHLKEAMTTFLYFLFLMLNLLIKRDILLTDLGSSLFYIMLDPFISYLEWDKRQKQHIGLAYFECNVI